jgi:hypothetical protein
VPRIEFDALPRDARVWVFGASAPIAGPARDALLHHVDEYLAQWRAHGEPLTCARDWRDDRFLAIGVDQSTTGASGCSIDAMFRILQGLESVLATTLVAGGRVFFRGTDGVVQSVDRRGFADALRRGEVNEATTVFDTTVTRLADYREGFERPLVGSWHAQLA